MTVSYRTCDVCQNELISEAIYCPQCLSNRNTVKNEWFPVDESGTDNPIVEHELVPEHRIYPEQKVKELLREYNIERNDLPKIKAKDPALEHLEIARWDVIKIIRDSRTTDKSESYRLVISGLKDTGSSSTPGWRNPDNPAPEVYEFSEQADPEQALHILENMRAHVPPSAPGACRRIAVDRETEIATAIDRLRKGEPYTFIQGELGYGKSFFLHWLRDKAFSYSAVSIIDLGDGITFSDPATVVRAFRDGLETPRSIQNTHYANGFDELWDTLLRQVSDICASYYEREGYELREDRMSESIRRAVEDLLTEAETPSEIRSQLVNAAANHFDGSHQSLSQSLLGKTTSTSAFDHLNLMATLAQLNGYRLLLGVDELEKAERSSEHFEAIVTFVESMPENVTLFFTGTPELVEGGKEGNAFHESHQGLYDLTIANRIRLDQPSRNDLQKFTDRLLSMEELALDQQQREYSTAVQGLDGVEKTVETFLEQQPPTFRGYLEFLEKKAN